MISAWRFAVRPFTVLLAVLAVMFSFSLVGTAVAAPGGNGNGKGQTDDPAVSTTTSQGQSAKAGTKSDKGSSNKGGATPSDHQTSGTSGTSGTPPQKQPLSNADQNQGGANGKCPGGPYCGTQRDKPSANGNGGGQSTGKPCASCVGKADNKNPKGQYPGPQDNNNGYECDGNHGIARGNPAHTGCASGSTTTTDKCVPKANEYVDANGNCVKKSSDDNCVPTEANKQCGKTDVCVPGAGEMVNDQGECVPVCPTDSSIPMDDEDCNPLVAPKGPGANRPPTVAGVEAFAGPQPPAAVEQFAGPSAAVGPTGILPSTGASTLMNALALTGGGLLLMGAATLLLRRKGDQA